MKKHKKISSIAGFLIPLVLFVSPSSSILLVTATNSSEDSSLAFPLSLIVLPFLILWSLFHTGIKNRKNRGFFFLLLLFFFWTFILALFSSTTTSSDSFLYWFQWISPYLYLYFFLRMKNQEAIQSFLKAFFVGTFFSALYVFIGGGVEFLLYGIGEGRMTPNLILPGLYQLYVYVPTVLAFSFLISITCVNTHLIHIPKIWLWLLYPLSFFAILFTASREGLVIYLLGLLGVFILKKKNWGFKILIAFFVCVLFLVNLDVLFKKADDSQMMIFRKYAAIQEEGSHFGGRDIMISEYSKIIKQEPITGSAMLPPGYYSDFGVTDMSSAHNYYVDTFAWAGFLGFAIIIFLYLILIFKASKCILRNIDSKDPYMQFFKFTSFFLLLFIFVSNNINVPMRQPLSGALGALLMFFTLNYKNIDFHEKNKTHFDNRFRTNP